MAIEAKHLRPRLVHVSLRPEARDALAAAFERRLTVVCAPAGYGKTTTAAAVLDLSGHQTAWYKLDVLDHDPLAFLAAMTRAVQRLLPRFGAALLRELESGPVLDLPPQTLAAQFCAECDRLVTSRIYLALDDYHETMDAPAMNGVLGYLLDNCPETIRFVVLTRYEPTFQLEKLRLAGEVARVPRDLLLFDADQVAEVLWQRSGERHDPQHVRRLHALTEGWPASVVLAGMALAWFDAASLEEALGDPRLRMDVFSYLAEQVFQRQSPEVQRFLLRTCCLEHVSGELAERLTGTTTASRHLHFLARNQVFTFDTGRAGTYRYHNLLRDFLRQRFVQEEGESAFRDLQRDTAVALEACGDRPGAVELLLGANDTELALGVIARGGEAELERRPSEQLRIWVSRLSAAADAEHPWALVVSAVLDAREGRFSSALAGLQSAADILHGGTDHDLYQVLSITEWTQFWSGDSAGSMETCYRALELASSDADRLHSLLSLLSASVDMRRWDTVESASSAAERLLRMARPEEVARAQALWAHASFYRGDMHKARDLIEGCNDQVGTIAQRAASLNTHGMIDMALGDYDSAVHRFREAGEAAKGFGDALTSHIDDNMAFLQACLGREDLALAQLERLEKQADALDPTMLCSCLMHQGTVKRRAGDHDGAFGPSVAASETVAPERDPYLAYNSMANLALLQGLGGRDQRATLDGLSRQAAVTGVAFVELKCLLFHAILAHVEDDSTTAVAILEESLARQLRLGHIHLVAQELGPRPELASLILRRHRTNGLGLALVEALGHYWRFNETAETLRHLCQSQVGTWIDHVGAGHRQQDRRRSGRHRPGSATLPSQPPSGTTKLDDLSPREREVLDLMASDLSNEQIAAELFIAIPTVKTHVTHILRKLGQSKRLGAILEYQRLTGLIADDRGADDRLHPPP